MDTDIDIDFEALVAQQEDNLAERLGAATDPIKAYKLGLADGFSETFAEAEGQVSEQELDDWRISNRLLKLAFYDRMHKYCIREAFDLGFHHATHVDHKILASLVRLFRDGNEEIARRLSPRRNFEDLVTDFENPIATSILIRSYRNFGEAHAYDDPDIPA